MRIKAPSHDPVYTQYTPDMLFVPLPATTTTHIETDSEPTYIGFKPSGTVFLDTFMDNLYRYGKHDALFHAGLLGLKYTDMCTAILVVTGMTYPDFVDRYILLLARDLLKNKPRKTELREVARRLGFGSYSGFYNFMIRMGEWKKKYR